MGFGGAGSMNIVLKNNKNLLSNHKREKFKNLIGDYKVNRNVVNNFPTATPQLLKSIRERMVFENEQRQKRKIIVFVSIITALITLTAIVLS